MQNYQTTDEVSPVYTTGLPHNREAEEAVAGALLINPEVYDEIAPFMPEGGKTFYIERLGWVWDAVAKLREEGQPIDYLTINDQLERMGRLAEIGGPAFLMGLLNQVPTTLHAPGYAKIVRENSTRRKLLMAANKIAQDAYDGEKPIREAISEADRALSGITMWTSETESGPLTAAQALAAADHDTEQAMQGNGISIKTGLIDLDNKIRGFYPSDLVVLAARPGEGKTALMLSMLANISVGRPTVELDGHIVPLTSPVSSAFYSLEMPTNQIMWRLVSQFTGIPVNDLRDGTLNDQQTAKYYNFLSDSAAAKFFIEHPNHRITIPELRASLRKLVSEEGIKVAFIDQLNYIESGMSERTGESIKLNAVIHELKFLANELNITIVVAHQMNRNTDDPSEDPTTADLDQAGDKPADVVIFIRHKFNGEFFTASWLYLAKSRQGARGRCPLVFLAARTRFESAARIA